MNAPGPPAPEPLPQPLGLPRHSVRATLALLLCGTLWYLALTERKIPDILWESGLLVVAFYFGVRSTAPAAPVATAATTADHVGGPQPLYLPRGSIRTVLLLGTPAWMPNIPENFLAWTVAFYFGSRLSP